MEIDELASYLASLEREDCYRVDATMKESPHELTQRVFFVGANGSEQGPYVRKIIRRESGMGAAYERIFQAQQRGKRFKHVPRLIECYQRDGLLVVIMEFASGMTLQDLVYSRDPSMQLAANVFPRICDAVAELHEAFDPPLIHRDLKPSNVMVSDDALTIIDFGIARELKRDADADTAKFGTRAFAPPEQYGFGQTTVRSDVYALGMILYFCLTEEMPSPKVRDDRFASGNVPPAIRPVLVRATALDPQQRYESAVELKAAFVEAAAQDASPASGAMRSPLSAPPRRRRAAVAVGALFATTAAVALAIAGSGMLARNLDSGSEASTQRESIQAPAEPVDAAASPGNVDVAESAASESMETGAPQRNGFDPATNTTVTIGSIAFQLPSYYEADVSRGDDGSTCYYAESGSSLAMLMTAERALDDGSADVDEAKQSFLSGIVSSDENLFSEIVSSTDFELAGRPARIVAFTGSVEGLPIRSEAVYFVETDPQDGSRTVGSLLLGQTDNALFDYSSDFARIVASAE